MRHTRHTAFPVQRRLHADHNSCVPMALLGHLLASSPSPRTAHSWLFASARARGASLAALENA